MLVNIMIGLPGSGKTTFTHKIRNYNSGLLYEGGAPVNEDSIRFAISGVRRIYNTLTVDLLHRNMSQLKEFMEMLERVLEEYQVTPNYRFYVFNPSLQRSLVNDFERKRGFAEFTIRNMYDNWDFDLSELPGEVIIMPTYKPTDTSVLLYESKAQSYNITSEAIVSDSWVTDLWSVEYIGDDAYRVDDEEPIDKYDNPYLEEFLEFLGDKNTEELRKELIDKLSVKVQEAVDEFYDYYNKNYYKIDMNDLAKELESKGLI